MTFDDWLATRQDARQWSEDEKACAELAWRCATKHYETRVTELKQDVIWLEHENWNLKHGKNERAV